MRKVNAIEISEDEITMVCDALYSHSEVLRSTSETCKNARIASAIDDEANDVTTLLIQFNRIKDALNADTQ